MAAQDYLQYVQLEPKLYHYFKIQLGPSYNKFSYNEFG